MNENVLTRVIPHASEAEQSVIGSMLRDKDAVMTATEQLTADDFYERQYSVMFEAMRELFNEGQPVDLVTLQDRLKQKDVPPEITDMNLFKQIMQSVPTSANIRYYCNIVKEKAVLRALIRTNEDIANLCYDGKEDVEDILATTEKRIFDLLQKRNTREFTPISEVAMNVLHNIEKASKLKDPITGVATGFVDLDFRTAGLQPSDLILVAARPSMGKTAFALNIIDYVGIRKNLPCVVFSLEMSAEQLVNRMLSLETLIDADKIRKGQLSDEEWATIVEGTDRIYNSNIMIDDTPGITVSEVRSKCRKIKLEKGISLIMIDYLQLMSGSGSRQSSDSRQQEISEISRSLKALAREMECPVVALSQLSRAPEQRPDHRPMLSDLRESGAIEQDADIVMFLYRDDYYNKDTEHPNEAEVIIAKQRNGPIGTVTLVWQPQYTRFVNAEHS
ncbi:replicative DNA helicase [Oribacterium sp. HCP28S3_H8]|uniref:replicative DNA helicase n=1 Tax=Oribacterium sp. HCP28S3_H8 TaxID=3438945 RepID=UPI00304E68A1|nr:replicative DNA helicase [Oribacterium sp.]